jgi:hypothetical protein
VGEGQSGGPEDRVVIVDAPYSEDYAYKSAKAYERNQCQQHLAYDAEDDADFPDLLSFA